MRYLCSLMIIIEYRFNIFHYFSKNIFASIYLVFYIYTYFHVMWVVSKLNLAVQLYDNRTICWGVENQLNRQNRIGRKKFQRRLFFFFSFLFGLILIFFKPSLSRSALKRIIWLVIRHWSNLNWDKKCFAQGRSVWGWKIIK